MKETQISKGNWSSDRVNQFGDSMTWKNYCDNRVSGVEILGITREKVWLNEFEAAELIEDWAMAMAVVFLVVAVSGFLSLSLCLPWNFSEEDLV